MGEIPPARECGLYWPGHDVHWIQALHSVKDADNHPDAGNLVEIRDDGIVVIEVNGERVDLWNHDPERLRKVIESNGPNISYQPRWRLLRSPGLLDGYCFDVAEAAEPDRRPCRVCPATRELA